MAKFIRGENSSLRWRRWSPLMMSVSGLVLTLFATGAGYSIALRAYEKQFDSDARTRSILVRDYLRERNLALGVFRTGDMLTPALAPTLKIPLATTLSDLTGASSPHPLSSWRKDDSGSHSERSPASLFFPLPDLTTEISFAGRRWEIRTEATPEYRAETASLFFLAIFPAGMLITILSSLSIHTLQKHSAGVEILVAERTAALLHAEARQRVLLESASDAIFVMNRDTIFDCNAATLRMFGAANREEIRGRRPDELSPAAQLSGEESRQAAERLIAQTLTDGGQHFEWLHRRLDDGENFIAEVVLAPLDYDGQVVLQATVRDITERKNAEEALAFKNMLLETQSETSLDGILIVDSNNRVILCNHRFGELWQIPAAILETKDDQQMLSWVLAQLKDPGEFIARVTHLYEHHTEKSRDEIELADGRFFDRYSAPLTSARQEYMGRIWFFRDISERKRAEATLRDHQQQLQAMNLTLEQRVHDEVQKNRDKDHILLQQDRLASIGQLAAGVAHEINNPVGYISANLRTLAEYFDQMLKFDQVCRENGIDPLPPGAREVILNSRDSLEIDMILDDCADLIRESLSGAQRVVKIVQDLKNFSRVDSGGDNEPVALDSCMDSALNICTNELKYTAEIRKEYLPVPQVLGNAGHLNQVFLNLLVNAGHAITAPGVITLRCRHDEFFVYASISDTGSGIPEEVMKRIFDPFFTTKEVGKGTGLGLSISSEIIRQHKGELLCESEVGKGTTFTVKLPRSDCPPEQAVDQ